MNRNFMVFLLFLGLTWTATKFLGVFGFLLAGILAIAVYPMQSLVYLLMAIAAFHLLPEGHVLTDILQLVVLLPLILLIMTE